MKNTALKIGKETNSLVNAMYSVNTGSPVVGQGATLLHWTDRSCFQVVSVAEDGQSAVIEQLNAVADKTKQLGEGHQNWLLEPTGNLKTIKCRKGVWGVETTEIVFTEEFKKNAKHFALFLDLTPEQRESVYEGATFPKNVVEGITRIKKGFSKMNLVFGVLDYHYDWTF